MSVEREPLWESCPECFEHLRTTPGLLLSFASVGVEHGKSQFQMAELYFDGYHERGHRGTDG